MKFKKQTKSIYRGAVRKIWMISTRKGHKGPGEVLECSTV